MEQGNMAGTEGSTEPKGKSTRPESSLDNFEAASGRRDLDVGSQASSDASSFITKVPPSLLYRPFPRVLKIYYQWNLAGFNIFHVCGQNERDRIFAVKIHKAYHWSEPLGIFPGLYLYNGPGTKDPLIAAFGQESYVRGFSLTTDYVVYLPGDESRRWKSETMRARTTPRPDNNVLFHFSLEVGDGKNRRRETFEWRKVKKSERDDDMQNGGFKLLWLPPDSQRDGLASSSKQSATDDIDENRVVAVFSWYSFFASPKHPFDLKIIGDEQFAKLGERCFLMVLITALGLWWLHSVGKTQRGTVAVAEKITRKGKEIV
ncbi:hypothetical protein O1611_g416 [Lasiodiplodia mahajangana]|uniref:Uncharacterized protein n=1 Tax=Lasiodiplodia mahajangana TaxID=1108764 RepID=A0ACC2K0I6_9PEZI|nr:hypothetical protein O1611_g416 [Lasiodiplodia mahajangana]